MCSGALWTSQQDMCSRRTAALPCCPAVGLVEEKDLNELIRQKEELTRERDAQVEQIVALRNEVRWGRGSRGGRCALVVVAWRLCASGSTRKKAARSALTARPYTRAAPPRPTYHWCPPTLFYPKTQSAAAWAPGWQVMEFQEKLRVAEIEKSQLEAEIQSLRDQMAQRKAEADKWVARAAGAAGVCGEQE